MKIFDNIAYGAHRLTAASTLCAVIALGLLTPGLADARRLTGLISMSEGLSLAMELKEGTISEVLRFVRIRSAPREAVDLTSTGAKSDRVFVGTDYCLYVSKKTDAGYPKDETYKIGRAHKLWEIKLLDGVEVAESEQIIDHFVGKGGVKSLAVNVGKAEKMADDVEATNLKFWLDEIVFQYDSPRTKGKPDNFQVITSSIVGALPSNTDDPQEIFNNFNAFRTFIKQAKDSDLVPFRDVLARKIETVEAAQASSGSSAKFDPILTEYKALQAEVTKRTEAY